MMWVVGPRHSEGFDVQTGSGPDNHSVSNRPAPWIAVRRSSLLPVLVKPCGTSDGPSTMWPLVDDDRLVGELERGLPRVDYEHLGVRMPMQPLRLARVQRGHEVRHHPGPAARRKRELRFA